MSARLLVLGGGAFVGRAVVGAAVDAGWDVTTFSRGLAPWRHPAATALHGDRTADLGALERGAWDAVVDTWAGAPWVVRDSACLLAPRVGRYAYVSSRAVYAAPLPEGLDESHACVEGSPDADARAYGTDKRGGELAVTEHLGEGALLARAGLILGPYEDAGRLPAWLLRAERGGDVAVPAPATLPWAYLDVRDLADWLLRALTDGRSGPVNLVAPTGHATTGSLLAACASATGGDVRAVWVDPGLLTQVGTDRWQAFAGWVPPGEGLDGLIHTDTTRAVTTGLTCRPLSDTVEDTWSWLRESGFESPLASGRARPGLDPDTERRLLALAGA